MTMTPIERVDCVLAGRKPDRAPLSLWHHFSPEQCCGAQAVAAHVELQETYRFDFVKVMNDNGYPHAERVERIEDLAALRPLRGDEPQFERQLELIRDLRAALSEPIYMTTTVFNAFATLRRLIKPATKTHKPPNLNAPRDEPSALIRSFIDQDANRVREALRTIAGNLATFAQRCLEAGADGVYLSVRDDWVIAPGESRALFDDLVRPCDIEILNAARQARFNMLHVCGRPVDLHAFLDYPVHVINWADRAAGPSIEQAAAWSGPALCAGVDNLETLPAGTPAQCADQARDALRQAGERPILVGPGCTYDPDRVPAENLTAVCEAVRGE